MYDIHSHVLPGIDDGAKTLADAVELCRLSAADGVRAIVATPHIREGRWPNNRAGIATRVEELRAALVTAGVGIEVVLGAEVYHACGVLEAIREGVFPTYADLHRYFLFELPNFFIARQVQDVIFACRTAGLTPVLAHPERNPQLMSNLGVLEDMVRMGALLQLTAMSVTGRFGRAARKAADQLLDCGMVHLIASDTHHASSRPPTLSAAYARIASHYGEERARALLVENPRRVIAGLEVEGGVAPGPPAERGLKRFLARVLLER